MNKNSAKEMLQQLSARPPQREVLLFPRGKVALPATIQVAGLSRHEPGTVFDSDGLKRGPRSFVLLKHTLSGSGRLRFEDRTFVLEPGSTMLITVPHDHRYWLPTNTSWGFFWLSFHGHEAIHICKHIISVAGPVLRLSEPTLAATARLALDVLNGRVTTATQTSSRAYDLIMQLHGDVESGPVRETSERTPDLERVISYARDHLAEPIGVDDLARVSGYSRFHFGRRFRESEGIPPSEFVRNERMLTAARLLAETTLPIATIAEESGYADASYFTKVFRRVYGMPPKAFRQTV